MRFIAKTLYGLEDVLAMELADLGADSITRVNRAVLFTGDLAAMYRVNYMARCAVSVLLEIHQSDINSPDDLYSLGQKIPWENYMDAADTFSVVPVVKSPFFNHTGFAALKLKDSIADYFRKISGRRPSVNTVNPDIIVNLHISNRKVTVSLDSSGDPLFKRGYRKGGLAAPLNEVLAAGMIKLAGWDGKSDFIDPMCGSGTLPIEAAMMASNIAPGKFRNSFSFQGWKGYDDDLFRRIKTGFDSEISEPKAVVYASDISDAAVKQAVMNAENAGVSDFIRFETNDFSNSQAHGVKGFIFINPPYGERLRQVETDSLYSMIGSVLKHKYPGYVACIISSNFESTKQLGLKPVKRMTLFNGSLECVYLKFELYQGSRKAHRSN